MTNVPDDNFELVERIFHDALELSDETRRAFLDEACGDDAPLRSKVDSMLQMHPRASAAMTPGGAPRPAEVRVPDRIGHFTIIREIASGGMGSVYEARQDHPDRCVALKVLRAGMMSPDTLRRFEHETSVLGRLRHNGIAQIYEAGTFDAGGGTCPYFAMELIDGEAVTVFANARELDRETRLRMFIAVAEAVQYAHVKGIIHRDLKPGNVLVTVEGEPKIIDFGIARVTDADVTMTAGTEAGRLLGTPQYMSPEQCDADPHDIDTRSDVYALGLLLYELCYERRPYDVSDTTIYNAARIIKEQPPSRPSTIDPRWRDDLETIVLKCLRKDRDERYQSAADLVADVRRYLASEPVSARRPSTVYRLRMFARRNRIAAALLGCLAVVLIASAVVSTLLAIGQSRARSDAEVEREAALRQARIADAVNAFLNEDLLAAADPRNTADRDITVREVLDDASIRIEGRFPDEPLVEAEVRTTIAESYLSLGAIDDADTHVRRALDLYEQHAGPDAEKTIDARHRLGIWHSERGEYDLADSVYMHALTSAQQVLGEGHTSTIEIGRSTALLRVRQGRYDEAFDLLDRVLAAQRAAGDVNESTLLETMNDQATAHLRAGNLDDAFQLFEEIYTRLESLRGEEHPSTMAAMNDLASAAMRKGDDARAEDLYRRVLALRKRVLGSEHADTLNSLNNIGLLLRQLDRFDEAEPYHVEALAGFRSAYGEDNPRTLTVQDNLGAVYLGQKRYELAELTWKDCVERRARVLGKNHPNTILTQHNLGVIYRSTGRIEDATEQAKEVVAAARVALPEGHWHLASYLGSYATCLRDLERFDQAENAAIEAYEILLAAMGPSHRRTTSMIGTIARIYDSAGKPGKAAEWRAKIHQVTAPDPGD